MTGLGFGNALQLIVRHELFRVMGRSHVINAIKDIYVDLKNPSGHSRTMRNLRG